MLDYLGVIDPDAGLRQRVGYRFAVVVEVTLGARRSALDGADGLRRCALRPVL